LSSVEELLAGHQMRSREEIMSLLREIEEIGNTIGDLVSSEELEMCEYVNDVSDALWWVLGVGTTVDFKSEAYFDLDQLRPTYAKLRSANPDYNPLG